MDEAGAWWNGVKEVYGDDAIKRAVSCEFHYKQSLRRQSTKVPAEEREKFKALGHALMEANTVSMFEKKRADLNRFLKRTKTAEAVKHWMSWWDARKTHIFWAFKATSNVPRMNLAETSHSTWAKAGACNLTLVDAARHDVGEAIRLEKMLERLLDGSIRPTGKGPSQNQTDRNERASQLRRAKEYGEILETDFQGDPYSADEVYSLIQPSCSHSPTKRGLKQKPKRKTPTTTSSTSTSSSASNAFPLYGPSSVATNASLPYAPSSAASNAFPLYAPSSAASNTSLTYAPSSAASNASLTYAAPPQFCPYNTRQPWQNNHPFKIMAINNKIKKCAGCPFELRHPFGPPFVGLVIQHVERNLCQKDGIQRIFTECNRYYHCQWECLRPCHPYINRSIIHLAPGLVLTNIQEEYLKQIGMC